MSWEENVKKVVPYVPGEQPKTKVVKLNTNENPYPPSEKVAEALAHYNIDELRLYPDVNAGELGEKLSEVYKVKKEQVFVGVGSDDVLAVAFMTFFAGNKPILFPDITYSFYDVWADLYKIPYEMIPLNDEFRINKEDYFRPNGGIVIPNPNAPTGVYEDPSMFEEIVKANPNSVVIIDEAYVDFGGKSCLPLIDKYDNVLVVQTFSKSRALAGLRIGVAFGSKKLIDYLKDVKFSFNSYTMNYPSIELATVSVLDTDYWKETVKKVIDTREWTKKELKELGFEFRDSMANFIFATHKTKKAEDIFKALREKQIYVRFFNKPRINNYLRISIGTDEDMKTLIEALKEIV